MVQKVSLAEAAKEKTLTDLKEVCILYLSVHVCMYKSVSMCVLMGICGHPYLSVCVCMCAVCIHVQ